MANEAEKSNVVPFAEKSDKEEKKRGRGRPPKAEKLKEELADRAVKRQEFIDTHPLVLANPAPPANNTAADRLNLAKHQMAREAAAIEFNKSYMDLEGKDTSQISSRIVTTLQRISDIDLEVKKLGNTVVDPRSEEVQRMAKFWIETLMAVVSDMVKEKSLDSQTMDLLINKFSNALEGWEDKIDGEG